MALHLMDTTKAQNLMHVYYAAGTYPVSLTVTNNEGKDSEIKSSYITVKPKETKVTDEGFRPHLSPLEIEWCFKALCFICSGREAK